VADAQAQSCLTHGPPRARVCCALYCLWARPTLEGESDPWQAATHTLRALYPEARLERAELEWATRPDDPPIGCGGGYVVVSLRSAR